MFKLNIFTVLFFSIFIISDESLINEKITTILPPGCKLTVDKFKNIIINLKKSNNTKLDYHQSKNFKDLD